MNYSELVEQIFKKKSFLCVGLDIDGDKLPPCLKADNPDVDIEDIILHFACDIVDATIPYAVAYKLNLAFYACYGAKGMHTLKLIIQYIREKYPEALVIIDAKLGDIGNTATQYAKAVFSTFEADAVTLNPYMGYDSIAPFLNFKDEKNPDRNFWSIILAITSNDGYMDFQIMHDEKGSTLYQYVLALTSSWKDSTIENTMFVVGATRTETLSEVRKIVPKHFLLVPGVGAQGGSLENVAKYAMTADCGLLVNSSRAIIYAGSNDDYVEAAEKAARNLQQQMAELLPKR